MSKMELETFLSHRLKDRAAIAKAARAIETFRRTHGRTGDGFDSVKVIRKLRDARR